MNSAQHARVRMGIGTVPSIADWKRREQEPLTYTQWRNAQREAEYVSRRNGVKAAFLSLWRWA